MIKEIKIWNDEYIDDIKSGDIDEQLSTMYKIMNEFRVVSSVIIENGMVCISLNDKEVLKLDANLMGGYNKFYNLLIKSFCDFCM